MIKFERSRFVFKTSGGSDRSSVDLEGLLPYSDDCRELAEVLGRESTESKINPERSIDALVYALGIVKEPYKGKFIEYYNDYLDKYGVDLDQGQVHIRSALKAYKKLLHYIRSRQGSENIKGELQYEPFEIDLLFGLDELDIRMYIKCIDKEHGIFGIFLEASTKTGRQTFLLMYDSATGKWVRVEL